MAGAGFKTFNTGDVLTASDVNTYLMQQTTMVFADASARSTALGANVAEGMLSYLKSDDKVYSYNGSAWVAIDTGSTSPLTTKGDLYTYSTTDARLPVGSNGFTLVADSSTSTGLAYGSTAQTNPVINGGFDIWQRGTANNTGVSVYTADRWQKGAATSFGVSRQTTSDTTNLPLIQYCARIQRTNGSTSTSANDIGYSMESVNSIPFAGQTITFSFYARCGANYSPTSSLLNMQLITGTGTDQNIMTTGFTGSVTLIDTNKTLTTTWQRFTATATIAATATQIGLYFKSTPTGTAGANDWYDITGVQIDLGSTALPFRRSGGTIQGELAACQRYYYQMVSGDAKSIGTGAYLSATEVYCGVFFPVTMRTAPTLSATSGTNYYVSAVNNGSDFLNSLTADRISTNTSWLLNSSEASSTIGYASILRTANASASIAFSAEL